MSFYPDFPAPDETLWALQLVIQHQRENPGYLAQEDCPYPEDFAETLADLIDPVGKNTPQGSASGDEPAPVWEGLEAETKGLYLDLKGAKTKLQDNDSAGHMSFFRTATSLLEKLVGLQERASGIRELHEFKDQTFKVIDSVLTEDQRQKVLAIFRRADTKE